MKTYDWIVVGGGITGAALSYELVNKGFSLSSYSIDTLHQKMLPVIVMVVLLFGQVIPT